MDLDRQKKTHLFFCIRRNVTKYPHFQQKLHTESVYCIFTGGIESRKMPEENTQGGNDDEKTTGSGNASRRNMYDGGERTDIRR
jgi:hypothetical protein